MLKTKTAKQHMRNKMLLGGMLLAIAASSAVATAQENQDRGEFYRAEEMSVDVFGTAALGKYTLENASDDRVRKDLKFGAGVGLSYFLTRNVGIGADAYSQNTSGVFVDSASANLIVRFPLGQSGFAPSIFGGGGREFEIKTWFAQVGAGMEYRFTRNIGTFLDARWVIPDETKYYGVARLGLRFAF
jgi:hypothetical protein